MQYNKKTVRDIEVSGKRILMRCDFNVPVDGDQITDDNRITAALPTINYLLEQGASLVMCSHFGRPKGQHDPKYSLAPVAKRLSELLGSEVKLCPEVVGDTATAMAQALKPGQAMLLENTRFHDEETANDPDFSKKLASLGDIFVNDAFGTAHRAHASTVGVADYLPAVCGFLIGKELDIIGGALQNPKRPFVAILGGLKISDKIGVLDSLLEKADRIIIGGGMAYTFLKALGNSVGDSIVDDSRIDYAKSVMSKAEKAGVKLLLPIDNTVGDAFSATCNKMVVSSDKIPDGWSGYDIGPETAALYAQAVKDAGTVIWNGPMGVFELEPFAQGTNTLARAVAQCEGITIIGGGDSAAAVEQLGLADSITHVSTGGGASLKMLEGKVLPGIACLLDK